MNSQPDVAGRPRLVRYELLYPLGSGGMGTVWVARATREPEKFFIVKTLLAEHADNYDFREMFFDEARIASSIDHVNVARIFDLGDEDGTPYLVMEIVDGESLLSVHRSMKRQGTLIPPQIALRIVADVCAGLHAAHELRDLSGQLREVVHRDVSPHNILVGMGGVTKVIDFGIAKARDRAAGTTTTGSLKGKIRYMSPEQAAGKPIDRRADIWATGVVLYLLLSGTHAIDGPHDPAILSQLLFGGQVAPLPGAISPGARRVVDRALDRDLSRRYATAEDMRLGIEGAIRELGLPASAADVAAFMTAHFQEAAAKRHAALAAAKSGPLRNSQVPVLASADATRDGTRFAMAQTVLASPADGDPHEDTIPSFRKRVSAAPPTPVFSPQITRNQLPTMIAVAAAMAVAATLVVVLLSSSGTAMIAPAAPATTIGPLGFDPMSFPTPTPIPDSADPAVLPTSAPVATVAPKNSAGSHSNTTKAGNHTPRSTQPSPVVDPLEHAMDSRH